MRFWSDTVTLGPAVAFPTHVGHHITVEVTKYMSYRLTGVEVMPAHHPAHFLDGCVGRYWHVEHAEDTDVGDNPTLWCHTCNRELDEDPTVPMVPKPYKES